MHSFLSSNFLLIFFLFLALLYVSLLIIRYYNPLSWFSNFLYFYTISTFIFSSYIQSFMVFKLLDTVNYLTLNTKFSISYSITIMPHHFPRLFILAVEIIDPYNSYLPNSRVSHCESQFRFLLQYFYSSFTAKSHISLYKLFLWDLKLPASI